ncbi:MAG: bifunctional folylpolyglutamate synthase/dihydrofolate synthase [Desulfobacteraceae bacterium]
MPKSKYEKSLSAMFKLRRFGIKLGLDAINAVLADLGHPQNHYRIIHIAGTNGKGSVAAMLSTIFHEAGYRVGRYTSPHLERFNERICINNAPISDPAVVSAYKRVCATPRVGRELTFFEFTTAMALHVFSQEAVEWAVIETGMGGRLDATNAVSPVLTLITNISVEHKAYLGNTLDAIAGEKAGIIKDGIPLVTGVVQPSARKVVLERAKQLDAPVYLKGRDFRCRRQEDDKFSYYSIKNVWRHLGLGLKGAHQIENAALVLAACETLTGMGMADLSEKEIRNGLEGTRWPGRLEIVSKRPLVILDGAHNLMAARKLSQYIKARFEQKKITLVIGVLDDKACEPILKDLIAPCHRIVITQPVIDRAVPAGKLANIAKKFASDVEIIPDVGAAVKQTLKKSNDDDVICVAGSLYVVGEAKTALRSLGVTGTAEY